MTDDSVAANPRRIALLDAATAVLATAGLRGLTHRAVDKEAGFPEGTCSVSFRTRAALLSGLTTHVGRRLSDDVRAMAERMPADSDNPLQSVPMATELLERWVAHDGGALMIAILELSIEALRTPDLAPAVGQWRAELIGLVEGIVCRAGKPNARLRAEATVASIEGIVLSALGVEPSARRAYIAETLAMVLIGTANG